MHTKKSPQCLQAPQILSEIPGTIFSPSCKKENLSKEIAIIEKKSNVDVKADVKGLRARFERGGDEASKSFRFSKKNGSVANLGERL